MAEDQERDEADISELASAAAGAIGRLATEVGSRVMKSVRSMWDSAREDATEARPAESDADDE